MDAVMKRIIKILHSIRTVPEEGRRLLAWISMVVIGVLLFSAWSFMTGLRLAHLSDPEKSMAEQTDAMTAVTAGNALTPLSGISESLKSLAALVKPAETPTSESGEGGRKNPGNILTRIWQWLYEALERLALHE